MPPSPRPLTLLTALLAIACSPLAMADGLYVGARYHLGLGPYRVSTLGEGLPAGDHTGERLLLRDDELGLRLVGNPALSLDAIVQQDRLAFRARDADTPELRALRDRRESLNAGLELAWRPSAASVLRIAYLHDALARHQGDQVELHADYTVEQAAGTLRFTPYLDWRHYNARYSRYYFGVDVDEARASTLPAYAPDHSQRLDLGLRLAHPLSRDWTTFADLSLRHYGQAVADSPLTGHARYGELSIGAVYNLRAVLGTRLAGL